MSLLSEPERRSVVRMAGLYPGGAWLAVQVSETLSPLSGKPGWLLRAPVLLPVPGLTEDAIAEAARPKPASGQILLMMVWSPADRALREHPGFLALGTAAGLLAFWDERGPPDRCELAAGPPPRLDCEQ